MTAARPIVIAGLLGIERASVSRAFLVVQAWLKVRSKTFARSWNYSVQFLIQIPKLRGVRSPPFIIAGPEEVLYRTRRRYSRGRLAFRCSRFLISASLSDLTPIVGTVGDNFCGFGDRELHTGVHWGLDIGRQRFAACAHDLARNRCIYCAQSFRLSIIHTVSGVCVLSFCNFRAERRHITPSG